MHFKISKLYSAQKSWCGFDLKMFLKDFVNSVKFYLNSSNGCRAISTFRSVGMYTTYMLSNKNKASSCFSILRKPMFLVRFLVSELIEMKLHFATTLKDRERCNFCAIG